MATQAYFRSPSLSDSAREVESLLLRYPEISEQELELLLRTFRNLPLLDFGLLAADEHLGEKLDAFYRDHERNLRPPVPRFMWVFALAALLGFGLLVWTVA